MKLRSVHPLVWTFVKLTALVAVAYVVITALMGVIHVVLIAAAVAAVLVGGLYIYNLFRRHRARLPVVK